MNTVLSSYSASSCSSHRATACPKPRGSRKSYWLSLLLMEMPAWTQMATILSQRGTPTYEPHRWWSMWEKTRGVLVSSLTCCTLASIPKITAGKYTSQCHITSSTCIYTQQMWRTQEIIGLGRFGFAFSFQNWQKCDRRRIKKNKL